MRTIYSIFVLTIFFPIMAMGYTPTVADSGIRNHSYSVAQITQNVYNTAKSQNSNAPVFKVAEGDTVNYYKYITPDLTLYKTSTNADVFSITNQGNGSISYLSIDNNGNVVSNNMYYNILPSTNNRTDFFQSQNLVSGDFIGNSNSDIDNGSSGGGAVYNGTTINGINSNFINNTANYTENPWRYSLGGAIYNVGNIGSINGNFIHNVGNDNYASGGAIYNSRTIDAINGDFVNNIINQGNGGAIYNFDHEINSINGNFTNNGINATNSPSAYNPGFSSANGGAVYNANGTLGYITGDFNNNFINLTNNSDDEWSMTDGYGAAIYNMYGTINSVTGDFVGNTINVAGGKSGYASGVAIYNQGTIQELNGNFINNTANVSGNRYSYVYGGAIRNTIQIGTINGNFIGNSAKILNSTYGQSYGGAIYNDNFYDGDNSFGGINTINANFDGNMSDVGGAIFSTGTIGSITGNFNDNIATGSGGAIYNNGAINSISGEFNRNIAFYYNNINYGGSYGGAISNGGTIGSINADFNNNLASFHGGAIINSGTINSIVGDFNGNRAIFDNVARGGSNGGAISNSGTINSISGDFINNIGSFKGGAIYNEGTIGTITGDFTGNNAKFDGIEQYFTYGGAVYNLGTINSIDGDFSNNSAFLHGGAIYNAGTINSVSGNFNGNNIRSGTSLNSQTGGYEHAAGGAIYNTGTLKMQGNINFMTGSDSIYNSGTILTVNGTSGAPVELHLQSVNGNGKFYLTDYTNAYLANQQTIKQNEFNISENSSLTTWAGGLRDIRTLRNDGTLYLNGGAFTLFNITGSGDIVITGDVQNKVVYRHAVNISNDANAKFTTNANFLINTADITNNGVLKITGGTLYNDVIGGNTIIDGSAVLYSTNVNNIDMNGVWNVGSNTVHAANANINGYLNMTISDISKDSSEYTGGKLVADSVSLGSNAKALFVIHENNLAKGESTGDLNIIDTASWNGAQNMDVLRNNRYTITFDETGHTFQITLDKTLEEYIEEGGNSVNLLSIARAWNSLALSSNSAVLQMQELLDISSQYDITEYFKILTNAAPTDTEIVSGTSRTVASSISDQVGGRLAAVGRSGGDEFKGLSLWGQLLFNHSSQSGKSGFTGNTLGFTLGADKKLNDNLILGLGYTLNSTSAVSGDRNIDATGHTFFTYAEYRPSPKLIVNHGNYINQKNPWHMNGILSYGMTSYDDRAAYDITSEYDTATIGVNGILGYDITDTIDLSVGARYLNISQQDYVDSLNQKISVKDNNILTASVGAKYMFQGTKFIPMAHVNLSYDVISSDRLAMVTTGTSNYQISGKSINPLGVQTGFGFDMNLYNWKLSLNYDLDWHPEFISHTGRIKAKYTF